MVIIKTFTIRVDHKPVMTNQGYPRTACKLSASYSVWVQKDLAFVSYTSILLPVPATEITDSILFVIQALFSR